MDVKKLEAKAAANKRAADAWKSAKRRKGFIGFRSTTNSECYCLDCAFAVGVDKSTTFAPLLNEDRAAEDIRCTECMDTL